MAVSKAKPAVKQAAVAPKISVEKKPAVKKSAASKPVATKSSSPQTVAAKPTKSKATVAKKVAKGNGKAPITPEQRYRMICDAAYFRAERRGFVGGHPSDDWVAAEVEVDELLRSMHA